MLRVGCRCSLGQRIHIVSWQVDSYTFHDATQSVLSHLPRTMNKSLEPQIPTELLVKESPVGLEGIPGNWQVTICLNGYSSKIWMPFAPT